MENGKRFVQCEIRSAADSVSHHMIKISNECKKKNGNIYQSMVLCTSTMHAPLQKKIIIQSSGKAVSTATSSDSESNKKNVELGGVSQNENRSTL